MERPVFLFASGWRTGSTLLQRLLCTHPDVHVWGENRGITDHLRAISKCLEGLEPLRAEHAQNYAVKGSEGWIAMLNPPMEGFERGARALLEHYYRQATIERGKSRWGFKEVRHGLAVAKFLRGLYPESRFILLVRHPQDALASARGPVRDLAESPESILSESGGPRGFLEHWSRLAREFAEDWGEIKPLRLRYEAVIEDPSQAIEEIAHLLDVSPSGFDRRVFEKKTRGFEHRPRLTREDRYCLESPWLWESAELWGYEPKRRETFQGRGRQWLDSVVARLLDRSTLASE